MRCLRINGICLGVYVWFSVNESMRESLSCYVLVVVFKIINVIVYVVDIVPF